MNGYGILLICLGAIAMGTLVFHQLLNNRLYVGYAVGWLILILGVLCIAAIPPFTRAIARLAETFFPSFSLTIISMGFVILVLIYFSVQLSILSERVAKIAQTLAISNLENTHISEAGSANTKDW
ncbi:MAG: DUF2304 domain-containing protein [Candidatus Hydrogenedentota bacterium]|nr:MAG: DUF2304 domain-containing protein [Candidatus Hydrogenedentota bacterium]